MKAHDIANTEKLIKALRYCRVHPFRPCNGCVLFETDGCINVLHGASADALEAADIKIADYTAAIDALDDSNDAYIKENERLKKRIAELEAQLPKEGEWIEVHDWLHIPQEERGTYRCSACGQVMKYPWSYCPNCGAKMEVERKEQTDAAD